MIQTPAGKFRHRISIEAPTETRDANGGVAPQWGQIGLFWASIEPLQGRELIVAKESYADVTHKIMVRYFDHATLTNKCRINFNGRLFNILGILKLEERNITYQIMARESLPA